MGRLGKTTVFLAILIISTQAVAAKLPGPLVNTSWLKANLDNVVILDVRSDIKSFSTKPRFIIDKITGKQILVEVGGYIPGALLVDYSKLRTNRLIRKRSISGMLPDRRAFETVLPSLPPYPPR